MSVLKFFLEGAFLVRTDGVGVIWLLLRETDGIEDSSAMNDDPSGQGCGLTSSTILESCVQCLLLSAFLLGERFDFDLLRLVKFKLAKALFSSACLWGLELSPFIEVDCSSAGHGFSVVLKEPWIAFKSSTCAAYETLSIRQ